MLIELDESVVGTPSDDDVRDALEALGRADAQGYHRVVALPGVTRRIVSRHRPMGLAGRAFARVAADEVGWERLQRELVVSLRVEAGLDGPAWEGVAGRGVLRMPLSRCAQAGFDEPAVLIGENYEDTELFVTMGRAFVAYQRLTGLEVHLREVLGGGGTTHAVYKRHQGKPPPCLAIVDGDYRYPGGPLGDVARKVAAEDDESIGHAAWLPLPVRSAENTLPHAVLRYVAASDPGVAAVLAQHESIQKSPLTTLLDIGDLRAGTPYYEAFASHSDDDRRSFWERTLPSIRSHPAIPAPHDLCNGDCRVGDRGRCDCPMVRGLGSILGRALGVLRTMSPHKAWERTDARTRVVWEKVGAHVAAWGAARRPLQS